VRRPDLTTAARNLAGRARGAGHRLADRFADPTARVDRYWNRHTVNSEPFATAEESERHLEWRFEEYPLFRELSGLWGDHDGEVVLDYGCGPGNDVTGFLVHTHAAQVIGVDVSATALELARERIALHGIPEERHRLIEISDASPETGLGDASVDYMQSQGVIHHAADPEAVLRELHRVLRPGGLGRVMVYNRDSVWLHLYVAYELMVLGGRYEGMAVDDAFERTTDGEDCPIARCYRHRDFISVCEAAGFEASYLGAYPSRHELELLERLRADAVADERLAQEHRDFLAELELDTDGLPMWRGHHAGVGGMYTLRRPA
jgi:SAM-dependent methyltransferase